MPSLNWETFVGLPGSCTDNFEMLCRHLIRRHYGQYGHFAALANQPGVEFHLKLNSKCSLGEPPRWYGWQCRWFQLPSARAISAARRKKIEKAVRTTEKELPHVTDWVLWTRYPLTKADQIWYSSLSTTMTLHQWTAAEVEEHLTGEAELLRQTYFGELVLLPDSLAEMQKNAAAPLAERWLHEVHQSVEVERRIRRMLGEKSNWSDIQKLREVLETDAQRVENDVEDLRGVLHDAASQVAKIARNVAGDLGDCLTAVQKGDLDLIRTQQDKLTKLDMFALSQTVRVLRSNAKRAALATTNVVSCISEARSLFRDVNSSIGSRVAIITAEAGYGKTHLAAELSSPTEDRPAGVLLLGRQLHARATMNDLAKQVVINGKSCSSMEGLIAALDAAGQRAKRRLPIVIDGLNEAEDPRDWKNQLASIDELLRKYPYVLMVCTLRPAFLEQSIPSNFGPLELPGFEDDLTDAIRAYFKYYRINATDADLPWRLLSHPLKLRLFCEVTNSKREREVGIEAMPGSLTALFDRYLDQASQRIAELCPRTHRFYALDVRSAFGEIGVALWEGNAREISLSTLRGRLHDEGRARDGSIVYLSEDEGVLLRYPGEGSSDATVSVVYDALAGHLVAEALIARIGRAGLANWLNKLETISALEGDYDQKHPLAADITRSLAGLLPRRHYGQQLWPLLQDAPRQKALRFAADLEGEFLDGETVKELAILLMRPPGHLKDLFERLRETRAVPSHPLNADFLDDVMRPLSVADRDLRWTEWLRRNYEGVVQDLQRWERRWRERSERSARDVLRARWIMWTLTSTIRLLRDQATRTLYWFGRGDAKALFDLALDSLEINDLYVPERMLAASYGVAMAHQQPNIVFSGQLKGFLTGLRDALIGPSAIAPTYHALTRMFVSGMAELAEAYFPEAIPQGLVVGGKIAFASGPSIEALPSHDLRAVEAKTTLHMDFENYALGELCEHRSNYDMKHVGHQAVVAHVLGMVWQCGWRRQSFEEAERQIYEYDSRRRPKTERYGKKYGWIGYYTYAGILQDAGHPPRQGSRLSELQIDPSFPVTPPPAPLNLPTWADVAPKSDKRWIREGKSAIPNELFYADEIGSKPGPWVAVHAACKQRSKITERSVWCLLYGLLVAEKDVKRLVSTLESREYPGRHWRPDVPSEYYTFAGEIPWATEFASREARNREESIYVEEVELSPGNTIQVEALAHSFNWESHHSPVNQARNALIPSRGFSDAFDLRGTPQSFDQVLPDGALASISFEAPVGFEGEIIYLREDLLRKYAKNRHFIWFLWGEREIYTERDAPDWLVAAIRKNAQVWRMVKGIEEVSSTWRPERTKRKASKKARKGSR